MNKTKRVNPFELSAAKEKEAVTAGHNALESVEHCPVCAKQMRLLTANNIPSFVCLAHRISFPTKD